VRPRNALTSLATRRAQTHKYDPVDFQGFIEVDSASRSHPSRRASNPARSGEHYPGYFPESRRSWLELLHSALIDTEQSSCPTGIESQA
jgi:hypothetical protein